MHSSPALHVVGLNSVRPWRHQSGGLSAAALERAAARLREAPEGALRVAVLHHHLLGAPWRTRKKPVARRDEVLAALAAAGAQLILGGHTHQAEVGERRDFLAAAVRPDAWSRRPLPASAARGRSATARRAASTSTRPTGAVTVHTYFWRGEAGARPPRARSSPS